MKYAELKTHTLAWQRSLKFAGFYRGQLDGLAGPLTREAATQWEASHSQLQARWTAAPNLTYGPCSRWPPCGCAR